jgi:hypothetical protein
MAVEWYCRIRGEETGPHLSSDLRSMVRAGQLLPENLVRQSSSDKWVTASRVKGLFSDAPQAATFERSQLVVFPHEPDPRFEPVMDLGLAEPPLARDLAARDLVAVSELEHLLRGHVQVGGES